MEKIKRWDCDSFRVCSKETTTKLSAFYMSLIVVSVEVFLPFFSFVRTAYNFFRMQTTKNAADNKSLLLANDFIKQIMYSLNFDLRVLEKISLKEARTPKFRENDSKGKSNIWAFNSVETKKCARDETRTTRIEAAYVHEFMCSCYL